MDPSEVGGTIRSPKPFVLDDDPTGTQSVHGVPVLTRWDEAALERELLDPAPACFLLANSRAMHEADAMRIARETGRLVAAVSRRTGIPAVVVSRSDSTLRGHFPAEVIALADGLGNPDAPILLCPFFEAGGRITEGGVHFVVDASGQRIPVGETEFARDSTFGYRASSLPEWVEERSRGAIRSDQVALVGLEEVRGSLESLQNRLRDLSGTFRVIAVDSVRGDDVRRIANAVRELEASGISMVARTAADYAAARAGISRKPILDPTALALSDGPLLTVVGSYVDKTSRQLERLLAETECEAVELSVRAVLVDASSRDREVARAGDRLRRAMDQGRDTVLFTSRERVDAGDVARGAVVATALNRVLEGVETLPRAMVAKGGITSSETAATALGMVRAWVEGAAAPGVPVWIGGPESRWPGMPLVVFPGNVGDDDSLLEVVHGWRKPSPAVEEASRN